MSAIITNNLRIKAADLFERSINENPSYAFIGKTSEWVDESIPDNVIDSTLDRQSIYTELLGVKRITSDNVVSVCPRYNWTSGNIYDEYTDDVDLFNDKNPVTNNFYEFYILTNEFNIYKCMYNNNRAKSLVKPTGINPDPFGTPDGYIWKYIATVTTNDAFNFLTPNWMPVETLYTSNGSSQWTSQQAAIDGSIDIIKVTEGGYGYTSIPAVTITGSGSGCTATAVIDVLTESISEIVVISRGSNYKNATVTITGGGGIGATAKAIISPKGGHGSNPRAELGATYKLVRVPLEGNEGGKIESDITYRRVGILSNILSNNNTGSIIKCADVSLFIENEQIAGSDSGATATISSIDKDRNWLYVTNISGSFIINEDIQSTVYGISTTVLEYLINQNMILKTSVASPSEVVTDSGDVMYIANRTKVVRGESQTEEIKFVISF
jgi:hypothetical protein